MAHPEDHTRRARRCLRKTVSNPSELCTAAPTAEGAGRLRPSNTSALPTHVWKLSEKPGEKPRQPGQIVLASSSTFWDHGFAVETCKREANWWLSACAALSISYRQLPQKITQSFQTKVFVYVIKGCGAVTPKWRASSP